MKKNATYDLEADLKYHAANPERAGEPVAIHSRFPRGLRVAPYNHNGMNGFCIVHADTGAVFKYFYDSELQARSRIINYYCAE